MTDLSHLVQDLRAEAHRAPSDCAELMRRAAAELEALTSDAVILRFSGSDAVAGLSLADADVRPAPFPPPRIVPETQQHYGRVKGAPVA